MAASPAATMSGVRASRSRRRSRSDSTRATRASVWRARSCGRTTSPTMACRRQRRRLVRSRSTSVLAATPVDQANYYGSPDYDYDHVAQDSVTLRLEHDFAPAVTLRNQTRYNRPTREAVITSIANAAAYNPDDESRHAQPPGAISARTRSSRTRRTWALASTTGELRHELSAGHGDLERKPVRTDADRRRHARTDRPQHAGRLQPGRGHGHHPDRRHLRGQHRHRGVLRVRRVRARPTRAASTAASGWRATTRRHTR